MINRDYSDSDINSDEYGFSGYELMTDEEANDMIDQTFEESSQANCNSEVLTEEQESEYYYYASDYSSQQKSCLKQISAYDGCSDPEEEEEYANQAWKKIRRLTLSEDVHVSTFVKYYHYKDWYAIDVLNGHIQLETSIGIEDANSYGDEEEDELYLCNIPDDVFDSDGDDKMEIECFDEDEETIADGDVETEDYFVPLMKPHISSTTFNTIVRKPKNKRLRTKARALRKKMRYKHLRNEN
ncbi:hypothetical protein WICPIJ_001909 [Wickerhamomyces pijperi]|uniref:Uncharacterized protein n=1 Tax=Wickerhamomyces pijperi TaxID=599730 RepID=A0A9P8Q9Y4_WICPI|nr:hypothetical protein WICPIJ_001909 [Wickerhamomyces pijperi]